MPRLPLAERLPRSTRLMETRALRRADSASDRDAEQLADRGGSGHGERAPEGDAGDGFADRGTAGVSRRGTEQREEAERG